MTITWQTNTGRLLYASLEKYKSLWRVVKGLEQRDQRVKKTVKRQFKLQLFSVFTTCSWYIPLIATNILVFWKLLFPNCPVTLYVLASSSLIRYFIARLTSSSRLCPPLSAIIDVCWMRRIHNTWTKIKNLHYRD